MIEKDISKKINDHLANERTFLAWITTSLGIMGFGFVVVKFSLFIRQITLMLNTGSKIDIEHEYSGVVGVSVVLIGAATVVLAYLKYRKVAKQIEEETFTYGSYGIALIASCMLTIGLLLGWYLIDSCEFEMCFRRF